MKMAELNELQKVAWEGFQPGAWQESIDTRDFIHMKVMNHSLLQLLKLPRLFGIQ